jgi:hypothetical protein
MSVGPKGHAIVHTVSRGSTLIIAVLASLLILLGVYSTPLLNLIRTTMTKREAQDLSSVTNVNREPAFSLTAFQISSVEASKSTLEASPKG